MSSSAKVILAIILLSCDFAWGQVTKRIFLLFYTKLLCSQDIPTLVPPPNFNPVNDASSLDDAMSGLGTDEAQIISVLCYRSFDQRAQITSSYNNRYGVSDKCCTVN